MTEGLLHQEGRGAAGGGWDAPVGGRTAGLGGCQQAGNRVLQVGTDVAWFWP